MSMKFGANRPVVDKPVKRKQKRNAKGVLVPAPKNIYDPAFHPQDLVDQMSKGRLNCQVASSWGIAVDTLLNWRKEYPEMAEAYNLGLTHCEAWVIENRLNPLIEGQLDSKHAFNATMALCNNKLGWTRGTSSEGITKNTQININSMQINNNMTVKELTDVVNKDLEYLQDMGIIAPIEDNSRLLESDDNSRIIEAEVIKDKTDNDRNS